jgi:hypothetical protein
LNLHRALVVIQLIALQQLHEILVRVQHVFYGDTRKPKSIISMRSDEYISRQESLYRPKQTAAGMPSEDCVTVDGTYKRTDQGNTKALTEADSNANATRTEEII